MRPSRRRTPRRPRTRGAVLGAVLGALLVAALATAGLVVAGVLALGGGDAEQDPPPPAAVVFSTTPLDEVDTTEASFTRGPFCEAVDPRQVEAALGGEPTDSRAWQNGDPVPVGATEDVGHEFGCQWTAADGTLARAWVFAPPVGAEQAALLSEELPAESCTTTPSTLGAASTQVTCPAANGVSVGYRGVLGDAWLTCEVTVPDPAADPAALADRAGRWCAGVLAAGEPT